MSNIRSTKCRGRQDFEFAHAARDALHAFSAHYPGIDRMTYTRGFRSSANPVAAPAVRSTAVRNLDAAMTAQKKSAQNNGGTWPPSVQV